MPLPLPPNSSQSPRACRFLALAALLACGLGVRTLLGVGLKAFGGGGGVRRACCRLYPCLAAYVYAAELTELCTNLCALPVPLPQGSVETDPSAFETEPVPIETAAEAKTPQVRPPARAWRGAPLLPCAAALAEPQPGRRALLPAELSFVCPPCRSLWSAAWRRTGSSSFPSPTAASGAPPCVSSFISTLHKRGGVWLERSVLSPAAAASCALALLAQPLPRRPG